MRKTLLFLTFVVFFCAGFINQLSQKITVAAAANMQYAMTALKERFEKEKDVTVEVIPGSSGKLTQQIEKGAPFDGVWVEVDSKAYSSISLAALLLKHGEENNKTAAEKFYSFLYSNSAKGIYKRFGYVVK